jgi:hypothetical protein
MESQIVDRFIFQVDHPAVRQVYDQANYKIIADEDKPKRYCALYFSSHSIYYPNEEQVFNDRIANKDAYEWFNTRFNYAQKHIFMRDIFKQWYLCGLNSNINSPQNLLEFLRKETCGYKVIAIGSSAGGYAATLYGSLLGAECVLSFNGQMELNSILDRSSTTFDPILFDLQNSPLRKYYNLVPFLDRQVNIYYFYSAYSQIDSHQAKHVTNTSIRLIKFNSPKHGIPFLKCSLSKVINMGRDELDKLGESSHDPILFSLSTSGCIGVIKYTLFILKGFIKSYSRAMYTAVIAFFKQ